MLFADRGYDTDWIGELAMKKGAWANIPPKSNRSDPICFNKAKFHTQSIVRWFSVTSLAAFQPQRSSSRPLAP
jgi:hypothetical protein